MKIWTDDEYIEVDPNDVGQLEAAMLFKAEHIKAKADPELFAAVAEMLSHLWDSATKRVDVVRCRECKHHRDKNEQEQQYLVEDILICTSPDATEDCWNAVWPDHFCSYGERKEGADND